MKPILGFALPAIVLLATACGISDKEKTAIQQAQQAHDDSIRTAQITEVKNADAEKVTLDDSLSKDNALVNQEQDALVRVRTAIYTANDEMTQIKAFHFGRLSKDREAQIQAQELKIQTLILEQTKLQSTIVQTSQAIRATKTEIDVSK
jgi:predicted dienelactone hydrolase